MLDYFSEDAIYHAMSMKRAVGKPALRKMFTQWFGSMTPLSMEVHRQVSDGKTVTHERTDRSIVPNQERTFLVASVFEVENSLITAWREYFDTPRSTGA